MKKLLVVDDDDAIRVMVSKILERVGYGVEAARDGQEAIEKLSAGGFDGMLLDLMMPRVDGFGVIDHLRKAQPEFLRRVVVMTAFTGAARDRVDPSCALLAKPFDVDELVGLVQRSLGETSPA